MPKPRKYSLLQVNLTSQDLLRLSELSRCRAMTRGALAREAIRFYLDNHDKVIADTQERELVKTVRGCFERAIAMLARYGTEIGTLYELTWRHHVETNLEDEFVSAVTATKQRLRRHITDEERAVIDRMKNVVTDTPVADKRG
jgi:hypothetical protein